MSGSVLSETYTSLLADIAGATSLPYKGSCIESIEWAVQTAPQLEKMLLGFIENGKPVFDEFPACLRDFASRALTDPIQLLLLRQLLLFAYKADIAYDQLKLHKTLENFFQVNEQTRAFSESFARSSPILLKHARSYVQNVLYGARWKDIIPSHGPGSVYPRIVKGAWSSWFSSIDYIYPYSDFLYLYFNREQYSEQADTVETEHITAKLIPVRKDSRGPRLICVHPSESIWIQKGLEAALRSQIVVPRRGRRVCPSGHINFDDQTINGQLAFSSSADRRYATLDMKEASDRVSDVLVQDLLGSSYKYFGCCRAQKLFVPLLKKGSYDDNIHCYAPMGNATTFPIQSIVFWAICVSTLDVLGYHNPSDVYVFGDDLIVPTSAAEAIINSLESFGLLVNRNKSFYRGGFRESCGVDAFNGVLVTPLRWTKRPSSSSPEDLAAYCNLAMRLRIAGYETAASRLFSSVRNSAKGLRVFVPFTGSENHSAIAEFTYDRSLSRRGLVKDPNGSQRAVKRCYKLAARGKPRRDGSYRLLAGLCALEKGHSQSVPQDTLSRRVGLSRGWIVEE